MSYNPRPIGHNGGPALEDEEDDRSTLPRYCKYCRHWKAPPDGEVRAYEFFRLGLSRRRVKRPTGTCDRVLLRQGRLLAFSATVDTFGCLNFARKPPAPVQRGRGFVAIYAGDHIVWQGSEENLPEEYR